MPHKPVVVIISVLLSLLLFVTSSGKLTGASTSLQIRDSLSLSASRWRLIGAIELPIAVALLVGLWVHPLGVVARSSVCALMVGAIAARVRAGGAQRNAGVAVDVVVLSLAASSLLW
jgi:hypothetical protein